MSETESEWLGGARTAAYLGVTAMTIWRWERDPKLAFPPASVIHGRKYWNRNDIDAWMRRMAGSKATAADKVAAGGPLKWEPAVINQSLVVGDILLATPRDRCSYLGTETRFRAKWLADHPGSWRYVKDIPKEAGLLVKTETELGTVEAGSTFETGDNKNDVVLVDTPGGDRWHPTRADIATDTGESRRSERVDES